MPAPEEPTGPRLADRLRQAPVTVGLIGLCLGVFVATLGACAAASPSWGRVLLESLGSLGRCRETLVAGGGLELARVWVDGEWWRVATTGLQHGSWLHVILNTWSLWVVGEFAEATWGRVRLLVLFAVSSTVGCLASVAWAEAAMVVGASAGVLGIAGALLVGRLLGRGRVAEMLSPISARQLGWTLALLLGIGFVVPIIAQAGHIGGLLVGALLGLAWADPTRRGRAWLARAGLLALAIGLGWGAREAAWRPGYHEYVGYRMLELDRHDEAADTFDRALEKRPDDPVLANAVAYALAEAGVDLERAERLVTIALEAEPENADYLDTLGWIHCRTGRVGSGLVLLRRAKEAAGREVDEIDEHLETCADADVPRETSSGR